MKLGYAHKDRTKNKPTATSKQCDILINCAVICHLFIENIVTFNVCNLNGNEILKINFINRIIKFQKMAGIVMLISVHCRNNAGTQGLDRSRTLRITEPLQWNVLY